MDIHAADLAAARLALAEWIARQCLAGLTEEDLLAGVAERLVAAGLPVMRMAIGTDTLHPVIEGVVFRWQAGGGVVTEKYDRPQTPLTEEAWSTSPFFRLYKSGEPLLRRDLESPHYRAAEFPVLDELRREGGTDYVALFLRFGENAAVGDLDAFYGSFVAGQPGGFTEPQVAFLQSLAPTLALALRNASVTRIAATLVETYLGRDAGRQVLAGRIARGETDNIRAVLWYSDLRNFTRIADTIAPDQIVPFLNDYAEALVDAVHGHGGQVMKFIGDGLLAIFPIADPAAACTGALDAAVQARRAVNALNTRRTAAGLAVTDFGLGLHVGEVFYGNIGSLERLDFTVVGPAVNEANRIETMCRSLDQSVVISAAFAEALGDRRDRLVSLGRYALKGVRRPQELFTLDPDENKI